MAIESSGVANATALSLLANLCSHWSGILGSMQKADPCYVCNQVCYRAARHDMKPSSVILHDLSTGQAKSC